MARRIYRDEKYEDIYQKLCEGEDAIFNQLKDVFLMAACIGYKIGIRTKLRKRGKDFPWSVFNGDTDESIINAIALAESNDVRILIDEQDDGNDDRETIIEEYANTGIEYLKVEVLDRGGYPVENLLTYINGQQVKDEDDIYNLDDFMI